MESNSTPNKQKGESKIATKTNARKLWLVYRIEPFSVYSNVHKAMLSGWNVADEPQTWKATKAAIFDHVSAYYISGDFIALQYPLNVKDPAEKSPRRAFWYHCESSFSLPEEYGLRKGKNRPLTAMQAIEQLLPVIERNREGWLLAARVRVLAESVNVQLKESPPEKIDTSIAAKRGRPESGQASVAIRLLNQGYSKDEVLAELKRRYGQTAWAGVDEETKDINALAAFRTAKRRLTGIRSKKQHRDV